MHYSDLESVSSSVESTPQSNHPPHQDSNEHVADTLQVESRNGDPPGEIQTNDVPSDTPHSQLEQNSAPSVSSDGSSGSILASDTKSQEDRRELDESDNSNLQKDDEIIHDIHASLEEGVPGSNYERKGREEEGHNSREMNEQGSINQASIAEEKGEEQLNGQVPITEHSPKGELSDQNLDEKSELQQEAGITSQAMSEGMENTPSMEGSGNLHEESIKRRETSELDGGDDRKIAESANQEASEEGPTVIDSSSQEESEGVASGGKKERETAGDSGELSDSQPQEGERREGDGEGERKESEPTTTEEEEESSDDEMMTFEEFKQKKREEGTHTCTIYLGCMCGGGEEIRIFTNLTNILEYFECFSLQQLSSLLVVVDWRTSPLQWVWPIQRERTTMPLLTVVQRSSGTTQRLRYALQDIFYDINMLCESSCGFHDQMP